MDIVNILSSLRESQFLNRVLLKEHHRKLIPYINRYNVDPTINYGRHSSPESDEEDEKKICYDDFTTFDASNEPLDSLIWKEITTCPEGDKDSGTNRLNGKSDVRQSIPESH